MTTMGWTQTDHLLALLALCKMEGAMSFSNRQKADCAEREVRQRLKVYPNLIARDAMSQKFADEQIAIMRAIAADYAELAEADEALMRLI